jgi:selenocysteine lyase/cysteine desulfurase
MGPQGIGFLYVTRKMQEAVKRHHVGWLSVKEPWLLFNTDQELDESARRYELGTPNANGIYGLHATLATYHKIGPEKITRQIRFLTQRLIEEFSKWEKMELTTPIDCEQRGGIVTMRLPEETDQQAIMESLNRHQMTIALREGCLRISPHYYNTVEEIEHAIEILGGILKK